MQRSIIRSQHTCISFLKFSIKTPQISCVVFSKRGIIGSQDRPGVTSPRLWKCQCSASLVFYISHCSWSDGRQDILGLLLNANYYYDFFRPHCSIFLKQNDNWLCCFKWGLHTAVPGFAVPSPPAQAYVPEGLWSLFRVHRISPLSTHSQLKD